MQQEESLEGVPDISKFLEHQSIAINNFAICSGATWAEIDSTLEILEGGSLKNYFKVITTKDDIEAGKPSPDGYLLTAERLNTQPKHCLAIEDTPFGITAAK